MAAAKKVIDLERLTEYDQLMKKYQKEQYITAGQLYGSTLGKRATAEGTLNTASGDYSHAEGKANYAVSEVSHAEGINTHAGDATNTGVNAQHAEGRASKATGDASHAQNLGTMAASDNQTALGKYNIEDTSGQYAVIIGNGTSDEDRSNAATVDWQGNLNVYGDISNGNGRSLNNIEYVKVNEASSADSAKKATKDSADQQIDSTYIKSVTVSGKTITITKGDGTSSTQTTQDTTYSTGNTSTSGLTKLYTKSGDNTDGTMTQKAIKSALGGKLDSGANAASATNSTYLKGNGANTNALNANDILLDFGDEG